MSDFDLVSIGDTTQDVFIGLNDTNVSCDVNTEECVLTLRYADKIPVESVHDLIGGNASNNAIGARRLGLNSAIYTIVGDDAVGKSIRTKYEDEGVALDFLQVDAERGSNYSVILNVHAERTILVYHEPRTYALPDIGTPSWIYLTSMGEGHASVHNDVVAFLDANPDVRMGCNPGTHQLKTGFDALRPVMERCDAFFVNKEEAQLLVNHNQPADVPTLCRLLKETVRGVVVVTDGMEGSWAFDGSDLYYQVAHPTPAIERTGAGDAYGTGFISALFHGESFADALTWGTLNSASVVQFVGPQEGLLTQEAMRAWRAEQPDFGPERIS